MLQLVSRSGSVQCFERETEFGALMDESIRMAGDHAVWEGQQ